MKKTIYLFAKIKYIVFDRADFQRFRDTDAILTSFSSIIELVTTKLFFVRIDISKYNESYHDGSAVTLISIIKQGVGINFSKVSFLSYYIYITVTARQPSCLFKYQKDAKIITERLQLNMREQQRS